MDNHHTRFEQGIINAFLNHCLHGLFLSELGGVSQEQKDLTLQVQPTPIDADFKSNQNIPFDSVQQWSIASNVQDKLKEKNKEKVAYERSMDNKIMQLNNDISLLTVECEEIEAHKSALLASEEETSAKKWEQISELSQVIFAIEMIENLCSEKRSNH